LIRRHRPTVALIERMGSGNALLSDLACFRSVQLIPIVPRESKVDRLHAHVAVILAKKISLPAEAMWRYEYVAEFVDFPQSFTDQVDATTQFLEFIATNPVLSARPAQAVAQVALYSRPVPVPSNSTVGCVVLGTSFRRRP